MYFGKRGPFFIFLQQEGSNDVKIDVVLLENFFYSPPPPPPTNFGLNFTFRYKIFKTVFLPIFKTQSKKERIIFKLPYVELFFTKIVEDSFITAEQLSQKLLLEKLTI